MTNACRVRNVKMTKKYGVWSVRNIYVEIGGYRVSERSSLRGTKVGLIMVILNYFRSFLLYFCHKLELESIEQTNVKEPK